MKPSVTDVRNAARLYYGLMRSELCGPDRRRRVAWPRQVAMLVARDMTGASLPDIGRHFGRDHTTVMHAIKAFEADRATLEAQIVIVAMLATRLALERRRRESHWVYQGIKLGEIIPARCREAFIQ